MQYIETKNVYINRDELIEIRAIEHDIKSRFIDFRFLSVNNVIDLTYSTVRVFALNSKGIQSYDELTIIDGKKGLARLELTDDLLVSGTTEYQLEARDSNGAILSSNIFKLTVSKRLRDDDAIQSSNKFSALDKALEKVDKINEIDVRSKENTNNIDKNNKALNKKIDDNEEKLNEKIVENSNTITKNKEVYDNFKNSILDSIGSENKIKNFLFKKSTTYWEGWKSTLSIESGFGCRVIAKETGQSNFGIISPSFDLEANKTYTVSFLVGSMYNTSAINYVYLMGTSVGNINLNVNIKLNTINTNQILANFKFSTDRIYKNAKLLIGFDGNLISDQGFTINQVCLKEGDLLQKPSKYPGEIYSKKINIDEDGIVFGDGNGTYSNSNDGDLEYTTNGITNKYPALTYIASFSVPAGNPGTANIKLPKEFTKRKTSLKWGVVPKGYYYNTEGNFFPFHVAINAAGDAYEENGFMVCPVQGYCRIQNGQNPSDVQLQSINGVLIALA